MKKEKENDVNRRDFLTKLGVTVGAAGLAAATQAAAPRPAAAATPPKGNIPDKPLKFGHMTYLTGPAAVLGESSLKAHILAVEEINAQGGLLGKRKIETITADESAGLDATVKEFRRMRLSENIDVLTGVISSSHTPALGPVAEELGVISIFTDGCTDYLFDKAVPQPKHVFRITNIQSADGVTCAVAVAQAWPEVRKIAHIHPDTAYGRNAHAHFGAAIAKLIPASEVVAEAWPKQGTTDFTAHITKLIGAKPDLIVTSVWGGDYVSFYKQGLRFGMFDNRKFATTMAFGIAPHAIGKDHPEGVVAGVHANYHFTYPAGDMWPPNKRFVDAFFKRWKEYPSFESEGAYTTLMMYKMAVERANRLVGGWPEPEAIISQLEGLGYDSPAGYIYIRPDNHQGYKDAVIGFSKNLPAYEFATWDPNRVITIPIRNITAPPGWPKPGQGHNDDTAALNWIKTTWPKMTG
jgi:branched-chain amino acid transport system substrate-binding protein